MGTKDRHLWTKRNVTKRSKWVLKNLVRMEDCATPGCPYLVPHEVGEFCYRCEAAIPVNDKFNDGSPISDSEDGRAEDARFGRILASR